MDSIDKLLKSLNNDLSEPRPSSEVKPAKSASIEDLLHQIDAQPNQPSSSPMPDRLFDDLKQEHEETVKQAEIRQHQQAQQKQERLEQLKKQRRQALTASAEEWLNKLDPNSSEGRWFEEFACSYETRLAAAIDYLEALEETRSD